MNEDVRNVSNLLIGGRELGATTQGPQSRYPILVRGTVDVQ